jgi:flagellar secretion chaperone FliS
MNSTMTSGNLNPLKSYRQAAVPGASPVRLIILLYEQIMEDLSRALTALRTHDIQGRTQAINHAVLIIGHLQGALDPERGGKVAENLERFYETMRAGLVDAHARQSASLLEQRFGDFMRVHEAWCEVERLKPPELTTTQSETAQPETNQAASAAYPNAAANLSSSAGWHA